jgi:hypothetical protein
MYADGFPRGLPHSEVIAFFLVERSIYKYTKGYRRRHTGIVIAFPKPTEFSVPFGKCGIAHDSTMNADL